MPLIEILRPKHYLATSISVVLLAALVGCGPPEQLPQSVQKQLVSNSSDSAPEPNEAEKSAAVPAVPERIAEPIPVNEVDWIDRHQLPWTFSEVQYVNSTRIGYSTLTVDRSELVELKQLRILREDVIDRAIDGSPAPQRTVALETIERATGELASFRFDSKVEGVNDLLVEGRVIFNDLEITKKQGNGSPIRTKIPWVRGNWGPFGIQEMLMRSPMKPGDLRSAQVFIPQLIQFVPVKLEAKGLELTPVVQGKSEELLLIELTIGTPESGVLSSVYADSLGVIKKTITRSGQPMLAFNVPVDTVRRIADQSQFSRGTSRRISVNGDLARLASSQSAKFQIDAEDQDPYDVLLRYHRQRLRSINPDRCELEILEPDSPQSGLDDEHAPDATHLESSVLIPSDKDSIESLASQLLEGQSFSTDLQKAEALRTALHRVWKLSQIAPEIASTQVSARDRTGSCIEGSHCLAALMRNEKIAAKVVCGLRIDPVVGDAQFHVWTQAWIEGRWVDLDLTVPGSVSLLHIAMSTTSGSGQNPYSIYLTTLEKIGKLRTISVLTEVAP